MGGDDVARRWGISGALVFTCDFEDIREIDGFIAVAFYVRERKIHVVTWFPFAMKGKLFVVRAF